MNLIKEDGTGVPDANTYADDADLTAYAADRGITLPATADERKVLLFKAMDYLETLDARFLGARTASTQSLLWPRTGVYIYNDLLADTAIPSQLVKAQVVIAIAAQTIDLFPTAAGAARMATRQTVGPITVEYSAQGLEKTLRPVITQANALLNTLFGESSGILRVVRA
jgi:hypothetical protein